jgi:type VI protein secretion system component VasK
MNPSRMSMRGPRFSIRQLFVLAGLVALLCWLALPFWRTGGSSAWEDLIRMAVIGGLIWTFALRMSLRGLRIRHEKLIKSYEQKQNTPYRESLKNSNSISIN